MRALHVAALLAASLMPHTRVAATESGSATTILATVELAASNATPDPSSMAATESDTTEGTSVTLPEMVVTGYRFLDEDASGITNLPLPIEKVPQSVSLVNNDFVKAVDLKHMGEVAQYTPGALWASYNPSNANQVWLRGFSANYAVDGLTVGYQVTEPDAAMLERYELVKGPASVVYGAQSPGGIVNLASKSGTARTPTYLELLGGSWGRWRVEGQAAGALNKAGTIRGIGVAAHEGGGSFVNFVDLQRTVAYGGLDLFDVSHNLTGFVRAGYQRTENTPFNGLPTFADGTPLPVSRSFFIGSSTLDNTTQIPHLNAGLTWQASPRWSFDLKGLYQHMNHAGGNVYNYDVIAPDGTFPYGGETFLDWNIDDYTVAGSATRKLDDVALPGSSVAASIRYQHYRYSIHELTGGGSLPNPNIFDGDRAVAAIFNALAPSNSYQQDQKMTYLTASTQTVVKVASPVTLVGGLAYSRPVIDLQVNRGPWKNYDPGDQLNTRAGLIVEPLPGLNFYVSYSGSYQPNLRVDAAYDVLPPLSGSQWEVGAKELAQDGRVLFTAALFDIDESNVPVYDFQDENGEAIFRAAGVRHRGLELEATGQLAEGWQVKAGAALLDAKVTKDPNNPVNVGQTRPWLPRTTANLYTSYLFTRPVSVSGGLRYMGAVKTYDRSSPAPTRDLPAYAVADLGVGYAIDRWHLQLNLKNALDENYGVGSPVWQSLAAGIYPGEPRSLSLSTRMDF